MKADFTRIAIILDRSGSMASVREATVSGLNEFVNQQKAAPGSASVKLVQFDTEYEVVFDKPLSDIPELTQKDFVPRGNTALYDAQGKTITGIGADLASMAEADRPSKVIVVTLTDGMENASKEYTLSKVSALIKEQRETYSWEFIFLGANQDAVLTAKTMNIPMNAAMTYSANPVAMRATIASASTYVRGVRAGRSMEFSDLDRKKSMVPK